MRRNRWERKCREGRKGEGGEGEEEKEWGRGGGGKRRGRENHYIQVTHLSGTRLSPPEQVRLLPSSDDLTSAAAGQQFSIWGRGGGIGTQRIVVVSPPFLCHVFSLIHCRWYEAYQDSSQTPLPH